jgi:glycosyl transferase family 87
VNSARDSARRSIVRAATAIAALCVITIGTACILILEHPRHVDFLSYWAAGVLTIQGHPAAAYDIAAHRAVEQSVLPQLGLIPFPYPPIFLFAVTPLGMLPMAWAFVVWTAVTIAIYLLGMRRIASPSIALANPAIVTNVLIGQNGFLISGIFAGGMSLLTTSPIVAGALLSLLSFKPQLMLLIPLALLAGREWKAFGAAMISAVGLWVCALAAFGPAVYVGFIHMLPRYAQFVEAAKWPWSELASVFAFARFFGVSQTAAFVAQALVACSATVMVCRLWWRRADGRAAALASAALLIPPYLFTYDALLLTVAFAWLIDRQRYGDVAIAWALCLLPVTASFGLYAGPNTIPVAAILCLAAIARCPNAAPDRPTGPCAMTPPPGAAT